MKRIIGALAGAALLFGASQADAANLVPDLGDAPTGWTVDRYAPDSFGNVGNFQGRSDVLGIGISPDDSAANRPAGFTTAFYNTQGRSHAVSGGQGDSLRADLYISSDWMDAANGARRTDMWGIMTDGSGVTEYPIVGFTNSGEGGFTGFQIWTGATAAWEQLAIAPIVDGWNSLSITLVGDDFLFEINGTTIVREALAATTGFSRVILQAYNFPGANEGYTAHWANAQVPEPASMLLLGSGLLGAGLIRHRARRRAARA